MTEKDSYSLEMRMRHERRQMLDTQQVQEQDLRQLDDMLFRMPGIRTISGSREAKAGLEKKRQSIRKIYTGPMRETIRKPWKEGPPPQYDGLTSFVFLGPTGAGKSTHAAFVYQLLRHDGNLAKWAEAQGVGLQILSHPSSLVAQLAKALGIVEPTPSGRSSAEDYRKLSQFKWDLTQKYAISQQGKGNALILLDETGGLNTMPLVTRDMVMRPRTFHSPVESLEGEEFLDRIVTPGLTLGLDEGTYQKAFFLELVAQRKRQEQVQQYRDSLYKRNTDGMRKKGMTIQFTAQDGHSLVQVTPEAYAACDPIAQDTFAAFMEGTMNSPQGMEISHRSFDALLNLQNIYGPEIEKQIELSNTMQAILGFTGDRAGQWVTLESGSVKSPVLPIDYFTHSIPAQAARDAGEDVYMALFGPLHERVFPAFEAVGEHFPIADYRGGVTP